MSYLRSQSIRLFFVMLVRNRARFPSRMLMIDESGYSVTATSGAYFPFGNLTANKEGKSLPVPSSTANRTQFQKHV